MTGAESGVTSSDILLVPHAVSVSSARSAAVMLAGHARNAGELREWLMMLGLIPDITNDGRPGA